MLFPKRDVTTDASRVILPKRVDVVTHRAGWSACLLPVAALHRDIGRSKYTVHALHASHISSRRWRCRGRHEKRKKKHRLGCQCQAWRGRGLGTERAARSKQNVAASTSPLYFHQGVCMLPPHACLPDGRSGLCLAFGIGCFI